MASPAEDTRLEADLGPQHHDTPTGESIADLLRRTRESYGQDVEAVAMQLRIRKDYLRAIEEGRFQDLPGATYAVGFVRTYAEYLGLDTQEVIRRFREEVAEVSGQPQLIFPAAAAEGKLPGGAILFLAALLAALSYGVWYYLSDREMSLFELVPPVPERLMSLVSGEAVPEGGGAETVVEDPAERGDDAPAADGAEETVDEDVGVAGTGQADAVEGAPTDETPVETAAGNAEAIAAPAERTEIAAADAADAAATTWQERLAPPPAPAVLADEPETTVAAIPAAPAVPPAESGGQVFGAANLESRVMLRARLESWVQVTDADGSPLLTRILQAGDRYLVPNRPGLTLTTGNAGGLEILVDGRPMPPLGPVGVVRRGVTLDPQRLIADAAARE